MSESDQQLRSHAVHSVAEPVHSSEGLLDVAQAASYIRMSARWLYRHYDLVPHIRIGFGTRPRIRFRRSDLDEWVHQHRIDPTKN